MAFRTAVKECWLKTGHAVGVVLENDEVIKAKKIVLAPGRDGSAWLTKVLKQHGLELYNKSGGYRSAGRDQQYVRRDQQQSV